MRSLLILVGVATVAGVGHAEPVPPIDAPPTMEIPAVPAPAVVPEAEDPPAVETPSTQPPPAAPRSPHALSLAILLAARAGDCGAALQALDELHVLDPATSLGSDRALAACFGAVETESTVDRYGLEVVGADLASIGLVMSGSRLAIAGVVGYFLAAPAVHALHGNGQSAWKSAVLRTVPVGVTLGTVVLVARTCEGDGCGPLLGGAVLAGVGTMGAVLVYDWTTLARRTEKRVDGIAWVPSIGASSRGAIAGIAGQF